MFLPLFYFCIVGARIALLISPMDGLENMKENFNIQRVEEIKSGRRFPKRRRHRKNSSKFFHRLVLCLRAGRHQHMLEFDNRERTRFVVTLKNKKSPNWRPRDISLFKELDSVFENRTRTGINYDEKTKGRWRSNMSKLIKSKYIRKVDQLDETRSIKKQIYEILNPDYLDSLRNDNVSAEVNENTYSISDPYMENTDTSNSLVSEDGNGVTQLNSCEGCYLVNFAENQIPLNLIGEMENPNVHLHVAEGCAESQIPLNSLIDGMECADATESSNRKKDEFLNHYPSALNTKNGLDITNVTPVGNVGVDQRASYMDVDKSWQNQSLIDVNVFEATNCVDTMINAYINDQSESYVNAAGNLDSSGQGAIKDELQVYLPKQKEINSDSFLYEVPKTPECDNIGFPDPDENLDLTSVEGCMKNLENLDIGGDTNLYIGGDTNLGGNSDFTLDFLMNLENHTNWFSTFGTLEEQM